MKTKIAFFLIFLCGFLITIGCERYQNDDEKNIVECAKYNLIVKGDELILLDRENGNMYIYNRKTSKSTQSNGRIIPDWEIIQGPREI